MTSTTAPTKTGMTCHLDGMGRILLPVSLRDSMGLKPQSKAEMALTKDETGVIVRKAEDQAPRCAICGCDTELTEFKGKYVCAFCKSELRASAIPQ